MPAPPAAAAPKTLDKALLARTLAASDDGDLFVFGYGSLLWRPGFAYLQKRPARVYGYCRRLAVYSHHYRGTPEHPGLVLGLDAGGCCNGIVYQVPARSKARVMRYLFLREMFANVYMPRYVQARTADGQVRAITFVVRRGLPQYAAPMPLAAAAALIARARGAGGPNADYFFNTRDCLQKLNIPCPLLSRLCERLTDLSDS